MSNSIDLNVVTTTSFDRTDGYNEEPLTVAIIEMDCGDNSLYCIKTNNNFKVPTSKDTHSGHFNNLSQAYRELKKWLEDNFKIDRETITTKLRNGVQ